MEESPKTPKGHSKVAGLAGLVQLARIIPAQKGWSVKDAIRKSKEVIEEGRSTILLHPKGFPYSKLDTPSSIRLLSVKPGKPSDVIHCSLHIADLNDAPSYTALSYTWRSSLSISSLVGSNALHVFMDYMKGQEPHLIVPEQSLKSTKTIRCDGHAVHVCPNLHNALLEIRRVRPGMYWIDAIGINQSDDTERSAQVQMMARIYRQAESVLVWLGPCPVQLRNVQPDTWTKNALEQLIEAANRSSSPTDLFDECRATEDQLFQGSMNDAYGLLMRLALRDWFSRVWVLQEYCLASRATFLLGHLEIDPYLVAAAMDSVAALWSRGRRDKDIQVQLLTQTIGKISPFWSGHLKFLSGVLRVRESFVAQNDNRAGADEPMDLEKTCRMMSLTEWLEACWGRSATDPRDFVFAGLGLIRPDNLRIDRRIQLSPPAPPSQFNSHHSSRSDHSKSIPGHIPAPGLTRHGLWDELHADYDASEVEVLINLAACLLSQPDGQAHRLLSISARARDTEEILNPWFKEIFSKVPPSTLPSWAPAPAYWTSRISRPLPWQNKYDDSQKGGFAAAATWYSPTQDEFNMEKRISHDGTTLICDAVIIDEIDVMIIPGDTAEQLRGLDTMAMSNLLRAIEKLPREYPVTAATSFGGQDGWLIAKEPPTSLEALARVLVANYEGNARVPEASSSFFPSLVRAEFCEFAASLVEMNIDRLDPDVVPEMGKSSTWGGDPSKQRRSKDKKGEIESDEDSWRALRHLIRAWDLLRKKYPELPWKPYRGGGGSKTSSQSMPEQKDVSLQGEERLYFLPPPNFTPSHDDQEITDEAANNNTKKKKRKTEQPVSPYEAAVESTLRWRKVFKTKSGLLGFGPQWAKPGDAVVLVGGGFVPYLLRKATTTTTTSASDASDEKKKWVLIGEAYVHGVMYGEALERGVEFSKIYIV